MILKALYDYYDRCRKAGQNIAPMYLSYEKFYYAIVIDRKGKFKRLEPLGDKEGIPLLVFRPEGRAAAPKAHSWGDNGSYVLGLKEVKDKEGFDYSKELKKNKKNHTTFKDDVECLYARLPNHPTAQALHNFYAEYGLSTIQKMANDPNWMDLCKNCLIRNITFRIEGETALAVTDQTLHEIKIEESVNANKEAYCLVTGQKDKPVSTTYSTSILGGKSNGKLVAFQVSSGYDSYGKKQGLNAPISDEAEFKYTTALNGLLGKNSRNKFMLGNRTFVFWASTGSEASQKAEESFFDLMGFSKSDTDDPNAGIKQVRDVFKAIYSGTLATTLDDRFYILGLAPNAARIAVVYWSETSLKDFAGMIERHFADMEIAGKEKKPYMGLHSMLSSVTFGGNASDATPNLPEAIAKSIFQGLPYPFTLFSSCIRRIRAEQGDVRIGRAAIIKAYLNRLSNDNNNQKINVMLDKENTNQGYLCGRLFAVLDRVQDLASNGQVHSIREKYMNAASATPSAVFATILNLSSHHAKNIEKVGFRNFYEDLKREIIDKISADGFPAHLDLQDQGRFFVGYYHQWKKFFTKKETEEKETATEK